MSEAWNCSRGCCSRWSWWKISNWGTRQITPVGGGGALHQYHVVLPIVDESWSDLRNTGKERARTFLVLCTYCWRTSSTMCRGSENLITSIMHYLQKGTWGRWRDSKKIFWHPGGAGILPAMISSCDWMSPLRRMKALLDEEYGPSDAPQNL